jgi:hypothetical protein
MKNLFLLVCIVCSNLIYAQSFNGVPISGSIPNAVSKLKAKGYTLYKYLGDGAVIMKGKINLENVEIFLYETPKTKQLFKLTVYFEEASSWRSIKSQYERLLETLTSKYGEPDNSYANFKSPYYEGDGYEMSAIELDKCDFTAYWLNKDNLSLSIQISKWKQVRLSYENDKLIDLYKIEKNEQNKTIF